MAEPYLVVKNALNPGEQWDFQSRGACPTVEQVWEGDGPVSFAYEFTQGTDRLPPRQAIVEVHDDVHGRFWKGVLLNRDPAELSECQGQVSLRADGDRVRMGWKKCDTSTVYGPVFSGTSLGLRPEDAIMDAFGTLGAGLDWNPANIANSGFLLPDTENFLGRSLTDVVSTVTAVGAGLATPFVWSVRDGLFRWNTLDLSPRYQVSLANGAKVKVADDATRLYTRIICLWGNNQIVTYPDTLVYTQIPNQVDLVIHAGAEARTADAAERIAEAVYARLQYLELGWSGTVTVPGDTRVEKLGTGPIDPWLIPAQSFIRVDDMDFATKYGPHHPCPDVLLMTGISYNGSTNETSIRLGEWRDPTATIKRVMYTDTSRIFSAPHKREISRPHRDVNKLPIIGQQSSTASTTGPSPIHPGIPQQAAKQNTLDPSVLPPIPPLQQFHDGEPDTSGVKTKVGVPPMKVLSWSALTSGIQSNYAGNWTRRSNGAVVASFDLAGSSEKIDQSVGSTTVNSTIGVINTDDFLIFTVTTPASSTAVTFVTNTLRCVRHYEGYAVNPHPRTGALAT